MGTHYRGTETERRALDGYIKLARAAEATGATINDHLRDYGLTVSQFGVIEALYHLGPMTVGELGEKILKSSGNMTLVADNLVKRGLVTHWRRSDDRRCVEIRLSAAGEALLEQIWPHRGVVAAFSPLAEQEQLPWPQAGPGAGAVLRSRVTFVTLSVAKLSGFCLGGRPLRSLQNDRSVRRHPCRWTCHVEQSETSLPLVRQGWRTYESTLALA